MKLSLVTPDDTLSYDVLWVEMNTHAGNIVIRPNHAPLIALLATGKPLQYCLLDGSISTVLIIKGIAQVTRTHVTVISSLAS